MKVPPLSQALRLGEFVPRGNKGQWFTRDGSGERCGGCAVGRALMSIGYCGPDNQYALVSFIESTWPWTKVPLTNPPSAGRGYISTDDRSENHTVNVISYLYEKGGWSMQQIASWVESIEPVEPHAAQGVEDKIEQEVEA